MGKMNSLSQTIWQNGLQHSHVKNSQIISLLGSSIIVFRPIQARRIIRSFLEVRFFLSFFPPDDR